MTTKLSAKKTKKPKLKSAAAKKSAKSATASKKKTAKTSKPQAPKLPRLPKGGLKDIGLMSFGKKAVRKKSSKKAPGKLGLSLAATIADRQRVADTSVSPHRKICDLVITAGDSTLHSGTAFFVSPRILVTCGHCLFVFKPGTAAHGPVSKVLVMPARNGETDADHSLVGWVEVTSENMRVHDRWRLNGDLEFDYGVLILPPDRPLGDRVGFFNVKPFPDQELNGARPTLSGYPDNVPDGTQWFEKNPIRQVTPTRLFYDIFTFAGQSGSPVYFDNNTPQTVCAIHNFGDVPFNSGVRITSAVIDQLNTWSA